MRPARTKVLGVFDRSKPEWATVTLEREYELFVVRPLRRRRTYELPLHVVAAMVVQRVVKAEVFKAKMEKAQERKARRGRR